MGLVLNFSPIQFDDREIRVGRLPYGKDGEQVLQGLRDGHYATHVFLRDSDSILGVSVAADAPLIGEPETIQLKQHLRLAAALRMRPLAWWGTTQRVSSSVQPLRATAWRMTWWA